MIMDINPGSADGVFIGDPSHPDSLFFGVLSGQIYFNGQQSGATGLWRTDGTAAGTQRVKPEPPGPDSLTSASEFATLDGVLYFVGHDSNHGSELWRSDGSAAGTYMVNDLVPGPFSGFGAASSIMCTFNHRLIFSARGLDNRETLWSYDPSGGTLSRLDPDNGYPNFHADSFTEFHNSLYFTASSYDANARLDLWKTDGTPGGTVRVFCAGAGVGSDRACADPTIMGSSLFFTVRFNTFGGELWRTDGVSAPIQVRVGVQTDTNPPVRLAGTFSPIALQAVGNTLYFTGMNDSDGQELWTFDGTVARQAADLSYIVRSPDPTDYTPSTIFGPLTSMNEKLYFVAERVVNFQSVEGAELWVYDPALPFPHAPILDIFGGSNRNSSSPASFARLNGKLYFTATDATGRELWETDGTATGTHQVADISPGTGSSNPQHMFVLGDTLYFMANDGTHGYELWKYTPNQAPVANVGEPYQTSEGLSVTFDASASTDPEGDPLSYTWDIDGDGVFGDESVTSFSGGGEFGDGGSGTQSSPTLSLSWLQLNLLGIVDGDSTRTLSVKVSDGQFDAISTTTFTLLDTPPLIDVAGADTVNEGSPFTLALGDIADPGQDTVTQWIVHWGDGETSSYSSGGDVTHTYANPGTYPIVVDLVDEDGTHEGSGNKSVIVILAKADASISITPYIGTYDGEAHALTGMATGVNGEDLSGLLHFGASQINAGHSDVTWTFDGNDNYDAASGTSTIDISRANPIANIGSVAPTTYDGLSHGTTGQVVGVNGVVLSNAVVYTDSLGNVLSGAPVNAGTYTAAVSFPGDDNYTPASASTAILIGKMTPTASIDPVTANYDGLSHGTIGQVLGVNGIVLQSDITYRDSQNNVLNGAPVNAGVYTATISFLGDNNYAPASAATTVVILSAEDQLSLLIGDVADLGLSSGNASALTTKLSNAFTKLSQGNVTAGVNLMQAFINQVNAFAHSGKLSRTDADELIAAANAVIYSATH